MENYEETLAKVREMFKNDKFATENGIVIDEIGEDYAVCSVKLTDKHRNAMGGVMGGVHCTLADFAFAVASNWQHMDTVALSTDIAFMSAVKGDTLIAVAKLAKDGYTVNCYHITITDNLGTAVAFAKTVGYHNKRKSGK